MADGENRLYSALMAIKPEGLSFNAWALKAEVNRSVWNDLKKRGNLRHDIVAKLVEAAGVSLAEFGAGMQKVKAEVRGTGLVGYREVDEEFYGPDPLPRLPLHGSAVGGEYGSAEEHIELTELHLNEVLDWLARPASLARDTEAYALTIAGDSMVPRFKPGERVAVSPKASISVGDDVIVQLRAADGDDDRVTMVLVKELVRRSGEHIELRQFNPPRTFRIELKRVAAMHKVKGHYF